MNALVAVLSSIRLLPHTLCYVFSRNDCFQIDLESWSGKYLGMATHNGPRRMYAFLSLMTFYQEFRNLFYFRFGRVSRIFQFMCAPLPTLYVHSGKIGAGLFIQHGFASIIDAESIGDNCWINQQVSIGWADTSGRPRIGNGVKVGAGAKVLGNITIGDNVKIGANAVVLRDVPPDCTVVGVPARIVRMNGVKVNRAL